MPTINVGYDDTKQEMDDILDQGIKAVISTLTERELRQLGGEGMVLTWLEGGPEWHPAILPHPEWQAFRSRLDAAPSGKEARAALTELKTSIGAT